MRLGDTATGEPLPAAPLCRDVIRTVATALREEASRTGERRLLVLAGGHDRCLEAAREVLGTIDVDPADAIAVGERDIGVERVPPERTQTLLGTTHEALVFDAHAGLSPNAIGQVVGSVDGGGLLVLLAPPLDSWPDRVDPADEAFAVPPFEVRDVSANFRERFVGTLRVHRGVGIADVDRERVLDDGLTRPAPRLDRSPPAAPEHHDFPEAVYDACLTADQVDVLAAFEALRDPGRALVVEADRGRGKSSAAGIAAAALAFEGADVLVTAPGYRNAREVFLRAVEVLDALDERAELDDDPPRVIRVGSGGRIRFARPTAAAGSIDEADVAIVDEAAALPVSLLEGFLDADAVGFATTVHGYEGAGRGFSVRFRDRLESSDLAVEEVSMVEPIRYAAGDPVEVWAFRALLLDATPPVEQLVAEATPETVTYRALGSGDLLEDEHLLREVFGSLVLAHYRTEPDDLARLLDAPNVRVRALLHEGHVVSVALLAREGGLSTDLARRVYEGERIRGNMIPDVLASQLGDEAAVDPVGWRVLRIATHAAVRSRGLGSHLLDRIGTEFDADWLGVGFGATPRLLSFWERNGFSTVHLSTTRNERSGEHSAVLLRPTSPRGRRLHDRHASWFADRIEGVLADALADLDPDVARAALRACDAEVDLDPSPDAWRRLARMAFGPGLMDVDPRPFRALARKHLIDPVDPDLLSAREERLLVCKVLQARGWTPTAEALDFHSRSECMRATGEAFRPLLGAYGGEPAREEAARFRED